MPVYNLTIDDASPVISYTGTWTDSNHSDSKFVLYRDQTFHATKTSGSSASFSFNGTGVYLYGAKRAGYGSYTVTIDGQVVTSADGSGNDKYQVLLSGTSNLNYGLHRVILTNTGADTFVDLDFVTIETGDGRSNTISENTTIDGPEFIYGDHWDNTSDTSQGSNPESRILEHTNVSHAIARVPFKGNAIRLFGSNSFDHGLLSASLDGAPILILNGTAPFSRPEQLLCHFDGLPDGDHTLTLENLSDNDLDLDQAIVSTYTTSQPPTASTDPSSKSTSVPFIPSSKPSQRPNAGVIAGAVIGGLLLVALILLGFWQFIRKYKIVSRGNIPLSDGDREAPRGSSNGEDALEAQTAAHERGLNGPPMSPSIAAESLPPYVLVLGEQYPGSNDAANLSSATTLITSVSMPDNSQKSRKAPRK